MRVRPLGLAVGILLFPAAIAAQAPPTAPPRDRTAAEAPTGNLSLEPSPATSECASRYNASPNNKGQANIGRMPPGNDVETAVRGVQFGEEWDPELRKRIEELGRRLTLKEDETPELDFSYVE